VTRSAAELARELRQRRRTRAGRRWRPWKEIAGELERQGHGRHAPDDVRDAVARLPLETHPAAPAPAEDLERLEAGWREGWAEEFPGEAWPGLDEARRRIRVKAGFG
jgi:hypothetical protein